MKRWIEAAVTILQCVGEGHRTPYLTFRADTDMVTAGLASLSSLLTDKIVVAEMNGEESGDGTGNAFQRRINSLLDRDDLRFVRLRRVEAEPVQAGTSFQEYRAAYKPPRLIFTCPHCGMDAIASRSATPTEYQRNGGTLKTIPDLDVRD